MYARDERKDRAKNTAFEKLLENDEEFYWTMSRYLARLAADRGVPPPEIDSVVEETWMEAFQRLCLFTGDGTKQEVICWLTTAVLGNSVDALRRLSRHPCESLKASAEQMIDEAEAKHAEEAEQREWLDALFAKVPSGHKENVLLLCLHYLQGFSIQELAQQFGMTTDAVDSRIRREREGLRVLAERNRKSIGEPPFGHGLAVRGKNFEKNGKGATDLGVSYDYYYRGKKNGLRQTGLCDQSAPRSHSSTLLFMGKCTHPGSAPKRMESCLDQCSPVG